MSPPRLLLLVLMSLLSGCASAGSWVELGGQRYKVEVADDDAERARGLMFRDELAAGHGLIFVHEREEPQAYWMKTASYTHLDVYKRQPSACARTASR